MAVFLQQYSHFQEYMRSWTHKNPPKTSDPLKVGVLSTANINNLSIIHPVQDHPDVVLYSIASRTPSLAEQYSKKHNFTRYHTSYASLISDPEIDFVYISLPNGLHYEWTTKALEMGKHVLVEKPLGSNAVEAGKVREEAERRGKVVMEAMHWRFHPAADLFRELLEEESESEFEFEREEGGGYMREVEGFASGVEGRDREGEGERRVRTPRVTVTSDEEDDNVLVDHDEDKDYRQASPHHTYPPSRVKAKSTGTRKAPKGTVGRIIRTESWMTATPSISKNDIRWSYDLSGGSLMDMTYVLSFTRFAIDPPDPVEGPASIIGKTKMPGYEYTQEREESGKQPCTPLRVLSAYAKPPPSGYIGPQTHRSPLTSPALSTESTSMMEESIKAESEATLSTTTGKVAGKLGTTGHTHDQGRPPPDPRIDGSMTSTVLFASDLNSHGRGSYDVHSTIYTDMCRSWLGGVIPRLWELPSIKVETEKKVIFWYNAFMPHLYHYIEVRDKESGEVKYYKRYAPVGEGEEDEENASLDGGRRKGKGKGKEKEKEKRKEWNVVVDQDIDPGSITPRGTLGEHLYAEETHITRVEEKKPSPTKAQLERERKKKWSTYRYQFEAFVDMLRGRRPMGGHWVTLEDSLEEMMCIDAVYEKSGLGLRPTSALVA
ncbi:hypothetical protein AX16_004773 [Volvariella volvacea WC 439]|nr:hypothetical protein AX16_004773 [Volvariella volvacea WC 439]